MREEWTTTKVVLERGGPWEVDQRDMGHFLDHARAYVNSDKQDPEAKDRVRAVWLAGQYRPAWQKFTPVPEHLKLGARKLRDKMPKPEPKILPANAPETIAAKPVGEEEDPFG